MPYAEKNKDPDRPVCDAKGNVVKPAPKRKGRPPLPRDEQGNIIRDPLATTDRVLREAGCPPMTLPDGKPNADHYRWLIKTYSDKIVKCALGIEELPRNFNPAHANAFFEKYAEINGVQKHHLLDARTDAEKAIDAVQTLLESGRSIMEMATAELEALERAFDIVDHLMQEEVNGKMAEAQERAKAILAAEGSDPKAWRSLIRRVMRLRDRARSTRPRGTKPNHEIAVEAARTLRFMVYVGRSNIAASREQGPSASIFQISRHHAVMALGTWEALHGVAWYPDGPRKAVHRYEGVVLVAPPGHGKPLDVETPVLCGDGRYRRLGDIKVGQQVITHEARPRSVLAVHEQGELDCVAIKTHSSRVVVAALDHPFMTADGWRKAGELQAGQVLALVHAHMKDQHETHPEAECRLAGYFIGDGNCTENRRTNGLNARISVADPVILKSIQDCARAMGFEYRMRPNALTTCVSLELKGGVRPWLRDRGMAGHGAHSKRVPDFIFGAGPKGVAAFLAAYFECDGTVNKKGNAREDCSVEFSSVSRGLLADVQSLLLRFSIRSRVRAKTTTSQGRRFQSFVLSLAANEVAQFMACIPVLGPKMQRMIAWSPCRKQFQARYLPDEIVSIEPAGKRPCRCLTVDEDETFTASDLVVHNSEFGAHFIAEQYCLNQHHQTLFGHAMEDQAVKNLRYVRACFDPEEPQGRRRAALYPDIRLAPKGNTGAVMQLDTGGRVKQASGSAYGIKAAISGSDASRIWFDDCVDQKEQDQESERDRTFQRINGTWLARLRGTQGFTLTTTTLWHPDDANMRRIGLAARNEIKLKVVIQGCGGPNSSRPFEPLWPEMYDAQYLRGVYKAMRNPGLYAAAYMADPRNEGRRPIKALRYFDPESPEHIEWCQRARFYLSADPAATNREDADSAGIILAAIGPLRVVDRERGMVRLRTVMRIIEPVEIKANQLELADRIGRFIRQSPRRIHGVLVETKSGLHATADLLEAKFGIQAIRIIPGEKSKERRLKDIGTLIENAGADQGFEAVVEFPGRKDADDVVPDERYHWFYDQFLKFGIVPDDHALDAVTQMVTHFQWELAPGEGWQTARLASDPRMPGLIEQDLYGPERDDAPAIVDDLAFFGGVSWN